MQNFVDSSTLVVFSSLVLSRKRLGTNGTLSLKIGSGKMSDLFEKKTYLGAMICFSPCKCQTFVVAPSHREFPSLRSVQQKLRTAGTAGSFLALSLNMIFPQAANLRSLK